MSYPGFVRVLLIASGPPENFFQRGNTLFCRFRLYALSLSLTPIATHTANTATTTHLETHTMKNTASINTQRKTKFSVSHRKEGKCFFEGYKAIVSWPHIETDGLLDHREPIDLRIYNNGSRVTACVWIAWGGIRLQGSGKAGGYGYCKKSAAVANALFNAGIDLAHPIEGVGMEAVQGALKAVADAIRIDQCAIVRFHQ